MPFILKEALEGVFRSFELRVRGIRSDMEKIDFDSAPEPLTTMAWFLSVLGFRSPTDSPIVELRNRLLGLSRDIAIVCGAVAVQTGIMIWRDSVVAPSSDKVWGQ